MTPAPGLKAWTRRLAAVLSLDVVGYTKLTGADEEGTHRRVRALLDQSAAPLIRDHAGQVIKKTGDGLLSEFESAVEATWCAVLIQNAARELSAADPAAQPLQLRIGINLGEILVEADDIYGDDVNVAVRLQALAPPGGIYISQHVMEKAAGKLPIVFHGVGARKLKNISHRVRIFSVEMPDPAVISEHEQDWKSPKQVRSEFSARPAVAVLPFANMSGDRSEDYFTDGLTEEIITALAGWRALPVIARNSTFRFRDESASHDVQAIGRELKALYIVQGSVRRTGAQLRVTARLIHTETGEHVFVENYNRDVGDIFSLQDELTRSIVGGISPELLRYERERIVRSPQANLSAYDTLQRGLWHHYLYTEESAAAAQKYFRHALRLDENYAPAAAALSISISQATMSGWMAPPRERYLEAAEYARRAVALDPRDPQSHFALGLASYHCRQSRAALWELQKAIGLNPSHAGAYANQAFLLNYLDRPDEALESAQTAMRLSPTDIRQFIWHTALSGAYYLSGRFEEAIAAGQRGLMLKPDYLPSVRYVVASLGQLGRTGEAQGYIAELRKLDRGIDATEAYLQEYFERNPLSRILDGLRKAGFD